ncbi:MAG: 3-isopropylmalate dehydratase small subunit [Candidatus Firestonebacteria bacterium]
MIFKGRVFKYGDDVNTDEIIPARYLNTSDPKELAKHTMEDIDKNFMSKMKPGDIIVGEKNFGCGSSREHAPIAIKAAGVSCVLAKSFARIFYRNSFNMGLPIIESVEAVEGIKDGDKMEVDTGKGEIRNMTTGKMFRISPYPDFMQELIKAGGLIKYVAKNR